MEEEGMMQRHADPTRVARASSWPRPRWMLRAVHEHLEGRLGDDEFEATARDAVRLAVDAQVRAGVDVVTDGEQRRDNYASFVGGLLDNCHPAAGGRSAAAVRWPSTSTSSCGP